MLIRIEDNPNCEAVNGRVFMERTAPSPVRQVLRRRAGNEVWCDVVAWGERGEAGPAQAAKVDDSGDGTCYLIYGGSWGLRLRESDAGRPWSPDNAAQWGEAFLLLPPDGQDLRFA